MIKLCLYLFGLSFCTLSFTSLRAFNVLGVSEVSIFLSLVLLIILKGKKLLILSGHRLLDTYWLIFISLLTVTLFFAELSGISYIGKSYHDYFAFLFCFLVVITFSNLCKIFGLNEVLRVTVRFSFIATFFLIFLYPVLKGGVSDLFVIRYSGLSHNPNQLALYSIFSLYISIYHFISTSTRKEKLISLLLSFLSVVLGFLSISDAFLLSFSTFLLLFIGYQVLLNLLKPVGILRKSVSFFCLIFISLASSIVFGRVLNGLIGMSEENGQGSVRFTLWRHGFEAMLESPIFGLGPGAWSGLDYPIQGHEAHNSYIDFGNSFGFLGILMMAILIFYNISKLKRENYIYLIFSLFSLLVFGVFHYILRFPFTWVILSVPFFIRAK
ncbi:O-antigen ligase family protein [Vibrio cyclitrophicus]|nr:O-antigen ligase family protein [Vibrio cyclitrophicus]UPR52365.1 O-antigen ligase family protein [Vibrio cyclitrophicus]